MVADCEARERARRIKRGFPFSASVSSSSASGGGNEEGTVLARDKDESVQGRTGGESDRRGITELRCTRLKTPLLQEEMRKGLYWPGTKMNLPREEPGERVTTVGSMSCDVRTGRVVGAKCRSALRVMGPVMFFVIGRRASTVSFVVRFGAQ